MEISDMVPALLPAFVYSKQSIKPTMQPRRRHVCMLRHAAALSDVLGCCPAMHTSSTKLQLLYTAATCQADCAPKAWLAHIAPHQPRHECGEQNGVCEAGRPQRGWTLYLLSTRFTSKTTGCCPGSRFCHTSMRARSISAPCWSSGPHVESVWWDLCVQARLDAVWRSPDRPRAQPSLVAHG